MPEAETVVEKVVLSLKSFNSKSPLPSPVWIVGGTLKTKLLGLFCQN